MGAGGDSHFDCKLGGSHACCEEDHEKEDRCQKEGTGEEKNRCSEEEKVSGASPSLGSAPHNAEPFLLGERSK
jgi:hypothetical protein